MGGCTYTGGARGDEAVTLERCARLLELNININKDADELDAGREGAGSCRGNVVE